MTNLTLFAASSESASSDEEADSSEETLRLWQEVCTEKECDVI